MTDRALLAARLSGAVWGHLVGDAVGVPYEFRSPDEIGSVEFGAKGTHSQPPGTWSDDGALMLALLDSLLTTGFDPEDQARRALNWYRHGAYTPDGDGHFDIGNTTRQALQALEGAAPAEEAGPTNEQSGGNGSLMRILPLALVERDLSDEELIEHAHRASRVTHGHERPQVACALYSLVVRRLLAGNGGRKGALADALRTLRATYEGAPDGSAHVEGLDHLESWSERGGRGRVWDSFWSAWDAFAAAGSYAEVIERAIRYGNDTDTTAAIAGGLAGIRWGVDGIPSDWLGQMRGREVCAPLIDGLLGTAGWRTSTANPIRVDWVDLAAAPRLQGWSGRLGMTFLPGKQRDGWSGLHWRDLEADGVRLRGAHAVDVLLLLVEDEELSTARVPHITDVLGNIGLEVVRHPITDMGVPEDRDALRRVLDDVLSRIRDGKSVVVACRGGLGRTGTVVGCLLRDGGLDGDDAIRITRAARRKTIENRRQEAFVRAWDWPDRTPRAASGYEDMLATFESAGLPEPPIPTRFRSQLRRIEEWCWATRQIDPIEMYMFHYPAEVLSGDVEDYVAVSHAGHGANSYGISLHLVDGPVAVFVQTLWGGVYTDNDAQAKGLDAQFRKVRALIETVEAVADGVPSRPDRLVVGHSDFRLAAYCGMVAGPLSDEQTRDWFEESRIEDLDPLSVAVGWLRALNNANSDAAP